MTHGTDNECKAVATLFRQIIPYLSYYKEGNRFLAGANGAFLNTHLKQVVLQPLSDTFHRHAAVFADDFSTRSSLNSLSNVISQNNLGKW